MISGICFLRPLPLTKTLHIGPHHYWWMHPTCSKGPLHSVKIFPTGPCQMSGTNMESIFENAILFSQDILVWS